MNKWTNNLNDVQSLQTICPTFIYFTSQPNGKTENPRYEKCALVLRNDRRSTVVGLGTFENYIL